MFLFIPYLWKNPLHVLQCLNTSHVLIYRWSGQKPKFIWLGLNTSHVLIYLNTWKQEKQVSASLNTSHVLIYLDKTVEFTRIPRGFKYISCSYLSRQSGTVGRRERSLNTSHVLIYPVREAGFCLHNIKFKYISCSYLSELPWNYAWNVREFKYISCSYLSHVFKPFFNSIYPFSPLNSSVSQNFTSRLSFFLLNQLYLVLTCINTPLFRLKQ